MVERLVPMNNDRRYDADMSFAYDSRSPDWCDEPAPADLEPIETLRAACGGKRVLEIACGGGNWAKYVQDIVINYTGIDSSPNRIAFAQSKFCGQPNVRFEVASAYDLASIDGEFDVAFAVAWFSHVPQHRHREFLNGLHARLTRPASLLLIDEARNDRNAYQKPGATDFYKRGARDGREFEIVDNKFSPADYERILLPIVRDLQCLANDSWTWARYNLGSERP